LTVNSNRRHGLKHEGTFLGWLEERFIPCIHLSPSSSKGDIVAWVGDRCIIFECKRVKLSDKTKGYRVSKNPKQHSILLDLERSSNHRWEVWYAISFLYPDNKIVTRFVPPHEPHRVIRPTDGVSWENMGMEPIQE